MQVESYYKVFVSILLALTAIYCVGNEVATSFDLVISAFH